MNVTITPDSEANLILSSIASSKLQLDRDVALGGESVLYREAKQFYRLLGLEDTSVACMILSLLQDDAISVAMTKATTLDRVCATIDPEPVRVERLSRDIIFDKSASADEKEP
jgi:hypothetical protein